MDIQTPAGPQGTQLATAQLTQEALSRGVFLGVNIGAGAGGRAKVQGDHFCRSPAMGHGGQKSAGLSHADLGQGSVPQQPNGLRVRPIHGKGTTAPTPTPPPATFESRPVPVPIKGKTRSCSIAWGKTAGTWHWRGKPGARSEQINKSKSANGRPARTELIAEGRGGQEDQEARLRDGGTELKREPSLAPSGGKSIPGDKPIETQPHTHLATIDLILRLPLPPESQELA